MSGKTSLRVVLGAACWGSALLLSVAACAGDSFEDVPGGENASGAGGSAQAGGSGGGVPEGGSAGSGGGAPEGGSAGSAGEPSAGGSAGEGGAPAGGSAGEGGAPAGAAGEGGAPAGAAGEGSVPLGGAAGEGGSNGGTGMAHVRVANLVSSLQSVDICLQKNDDPSNVQRLVLSLDDPNRRGVGFKEVTRAIDVPAGKYNVKVIDALSECDSNTYLSDSDPIWVYGDQNFTLAWGGINAMFYRDSDEDASVSVVRLISTTLSLKGISLGTWNAQFPVALGEIVFSQLGYGEIATEVIEGNVTKIDAKGYWRLTKPTSPMFLAAEFFPYTGPASGYNFGPFAMGEAHSVFAIGIPPTIELLDCDERKESGPLMSCRTLSAQQNTDGSVN